MIDLHVHTRCSDGTLSPEEVVRLAATRGLKALAITDHDTVLGVSAAAREGNEQGIEVVPGLEISSQWDQGIMHILGYFIDIDHPELLKALDFLRKGREARTPRIVSALRELGLSISVEEIEKEAGEGVQGRPHVANVMVRRNLVIDRQQAFDLYLGKGAPAYVDKVKLPPLESLKLINKVGGIAVLAHPYSLEQADIAGLEKILKHLAANGLQGIEAYYPGHTQEQTRIYTELARKMDLVVTGGTDFHGDNKPGIELGVVPGFGPLPYSLLEDVKSRLERGLPGKSVNSPIPTSGSGSA